jgi:uncharacterized protein (TIGR00255 family)
MTGFGRAACQVGGRRLVVELRAVNHRFLDIKLRIPWNEPGLEAQIVAEVRKKLERGAVQVAVRDEGSVRGDSAVRVDVELARSYATALDDLRRALSIEEPVTLALVAAQPGVLTVGDEGAAVEDMWSELGAALRAALQQLISEREREGASLAADFRARLDAIGTRSTEVGRLAADAPAEHRKRLEERLKRLYDGGDVAPERLAQEVVLFADRVDVTEELTRLDTHLAELRRQLDVGEAVGRRVEFLLQELHREINTIGSKSQSATIAAHIVECKAELERLREQVQNIE